MTAQTKRSKTANAVRRQKAGNKKTAAGSGQGFWLKELFTETYFGRVIIGIAIAVVIILINLLVSRNRYEIFVLIIGIETIIAAAAGWLTYLLRLDSDK